MGRKIKCQFCDELFYKKDYPKHLEKLHNNEFIRIIEEILNNYEEKQIDKCVEKYNFTKDFIKKIFSGNDMLLKESKQLYLTNLSPEKFELETTTIWSFPDRGNWATHSGKYRGNWSPYIPRNILLRYSNEGELILDQFVGSGTTLVEAKLLNRNAVGVDINPIALEITRENLKFNYEYNPKIDIKLGDARNLYFIEDNSIDLICTHPPYANIIKYSENINGDLSHLDVKEFLLEIEKVAKECYRVLKKDKYCAILIGDTRKKGHIIPIGFSVMQKFIDAGFKLKEIIIKEQHNCNSTPYWKNKSLKYNFLLIMHEYLFVFRK
ncbi:TRM11 family SAM-dependent methyltransferase [Caloramator australicus]|uniref:Methyltransferase n=1 Tax=Caloramator australicus RC3 TaxID=857293 RepID=I7K8K7_9CLOT|nr:DNA methyltransferase [Caloramator australicus]CCJ33855.1 sensor protein fixL(EC:2.7.3.-) [Caloramator australicus RC3]